VYQYCFAAFSIRQQVAAVVVSETAISLQEGMYFTISLGQYQLNILLATASEEFFSKNITALYS
jgi:hypothetical protein